MFLDVDSAAGQPPASLAVAAHKQYPVATVYDDHPATGSKVDIVIPHNDAARCKRLRA
jgi:hypothetical protein